MKNLTLLAAVGIVLGLLYLAMKQTPEQVSAPKIKSADALSANLKFIKQQNAATLSKYKPRAVVSKRNYQPIVREQIVTRRSFRKPAQLSATKRGRGARKSSAKPGVMAKHAVVKDGEVKLPRANDSKWVSHLSGENVGLEVHRHDLSNTDCTDSVCPDRPESYALVGVVVNPQRIAKKNAATIDGQVASGDGQSQPFLYVK